MVKQREITAEERALIPQIAQEYKENFHNRRFYSAMVQARVEFLYTEQNKPVPPIYVVESPYAVQLLAFIADHSNDSLDAYPWIEPLAVGPGEGDYNYQTQPRPTLQQLKDLAWDLELKGLTKKQQEIRKQEPLLKHWYAFEPYGDASDLGWVSYYEFFTKIGVVNHDAFNRYAQTIHAGVMFYLGFDEMIIFSKLPKIHQDANEKPHNSDGPAVLWDDGYSLYYLHNIIFKKAEYLHYTQDPINLKELMDLRNVEQRTAILQDRIADIITSPDLKAELLDRRVEYSAVLNRDGMNELYRFDYEHEPRHVVIYTDHSHDKRSAHFVPTTCMTVYEAKKWMNHGLDPDDCVFES